MLFPIVDVGANTVKLAVYDSEAENTFSPVVFKSSKLSLIKKRKNGSLPEDAVRTLSNTLDQFSMLLRENGIAEPVTAFATASLRGLKNASKTVRYLKEHTGIDVRILSAAEEAHYSLLGVCAAEGVTDGTVVDMGGGSTEVTSFAKCLPREFHSFRSGFPDLNEKYAEIGPSALKKLLDRRLERVGFMKRYPYGLYFIGGSAKAVAEAKTLFYGGKKELTAAQLDRLALDLERADENALEHLRSMVGERTPDLPAAILFFSCVMRAAAKEKATVSSGGAREGRAYSLMLEKGAIKEKPNIF